MKLKFVLLAILLNLSAADLRPRARETRGMGKSSNGGKSGKSGKSSGSCAEELGSDILDGTCTPITVPLIPLIGVVIAFFDSGSEMEFATAITTLVALMSATCITAGGTVVVPYFQDGMIMPVQGAIGAGLLAFSGQAYCCPTFPESATAAECNTMGGGFAALLPAAATMTPSTCCQTPGGTAIAPAVSMAFQDLISRRRRRKLSEGGELVEGISDEELISIIAKQKGV